jgi:membrane-bound lytic murein transglycosylase D
MTYPNRKTALTAFVLAGTIFILLSVIQGFKGSGSTPRISKPASDTVYNIQPFRLPDDVTFAGEKVPLGNFDTRESLDREMLISAYRHSSTILIIKRANRYLPVIEQILKKNNIPDDFKYLVAAESEYSNMISPVGATGFWQIMAETGRVNAVCMRLLS